MSGISQAHSVVQPSPFSRRVAGVIVILYAVITMVPLAWIFLTSIKSPPDSISYPPKILFQPTVEGYCNLFAAQSRQTADYMAKLLPSLRQLADHRLWIVPRKKKVPCSITDFR